MFPTRSNTNQRVQSQKIDRSSKFRLKEEEGLYYPYSENKGADQLHGYHEADLHLCFRICRLFVFLCRGSFRLLPGDMTKTFELRIQDECLSPDPRKRPKIESLLNDRLFT